MLIEIGGIIGIIVGIIKVVEFRDDRKGRLVVKLKYEDDYGLFGSTKRPCLIVTTANKGKKDRRIEKLDLIINKTNSVPRFMDEAVKYADKEKVKYPYKLESGDVLAVQIDMEYALDYFGTLNKLQELVGRREFEKFELIAKVQDTLGDKFQSNKFTVLPISSNDNN